jgi:hypothetical protein
MESLQDAHKDAQLAIAQQQTIIQQESQPHVEFLSILQSAIATKQAILGDPIDDSAKGYGVSVGFTAMHNGTETVALYPDIVLKMANEWRRQQVLPPFAKSTIAQSLRDHNLLILHASKSKDGQARTTTLKRNPDGVKHRVWLLPMEAIEPADETDEDCKDTAA